MDASGGDVEAVAFADVDFVEVVFDASVCHLLCIFVGFYLLGEAGNELAAAVGINDIPHFVLTHLAMSFGTEFIVGVNLDREVLACVDELDEQGEVVTELFVVLLAEEVGAIACYDFGESLSFVYAVDCHGLGAFY